MCRKNFITYNGLHMTTRLEILVLIFGKNNFAKEPTYPHSFAAYHEWEKVAGVGTAPFGKETKQRPVLGRNIFDLGLHKPIGL